MRACVYALNVCVAATAVAAPPEFHAAVGAKTPALWYRFGEQAGATSTANFGSLGAAFDGRAFNGVTFGVATAGGDTGARFNQAAQQYVESLSAAPASLTGNPTFTAEVIVRADGAGQPFFNYAPFLHWGAAATGRSVYFSLWFNSITRFYAGFYNGGLRMNCEVPLSQWYHIVWVRDSNNGANGQYQGTTLFVNGVEVFLEPDTVLPGAPVIDVTSTTFRVQRATDLVRYFSGVIDEVVLYPRALSRGEVLSNYEALGFETRPCRADLNGDCDVDFNDLLEYLNLYNTPC